MAFPVPQKCRDCRFVGISIPYSSLWLTCFPVPKMPKAQWDRDEYNRGDFCYTWMDKLSSWTSHMNFSSAMRISTNQRINILVHFVDWLFHALQTLANQWLSNYHVSMISSNILSLGSFFLQHRPFDTFRFQLHYTLGP